MDPLEIKRRWPGKFCLLGNIDLDLMCRGTGEQVERHVREKIERLNAGGGVTCRGYPTRCRIM